MASERKKMVEMDFPRENVVGRVGRMEQLAGIRRYAFEDGKGHCHAEDYNSMAEKGLLRHIDLGQVMETVVKIELA